MFCLINLLPIAKVENSPMTTPQVRHNQALRRFEIELNGSTAFLDYAEQAGVMILLHTFVPTALRGQGLAASLTQAAIKAAQQQKKRIDPQCSYAAAFLAKHPEYADVRNT